MFTFRPQAFFKTMNLRYYSHIFSSSITHIVNEVFLDFIDNVSDKRRENVTVIA